MTTAESENRAAAVKDSFWRAMMGRTDSPLAEFGRTCNGLATLRAAGVAVDVSTLWAASDYGRCDSAQLPIMLAVAGAVVGIGAE